MITAPYPNLWTPLSATELDSVHTVLSYKLNLTTHPIGSGYETLLRGIDLIQPNKSDVLSYLKVGDSNKPARYARASVLHASSGPSYLQEYSVGPLPATNATTVQPLTYPFNSRKAGKSAISNLYTADLLLLLPRLSVEIEDITRAIWNKTVGPGSILPRTGYVAFEEDGKQSLWGALLNAPTSGFDSVTILPLGVYFQLDVTSKTWRDWHVTAWYHDSKLYNSTDSFRAEVTRPDFVKPLANVDGEWTSTDRHGAQLPLDDMPPPVTMSMGRRRFKLDVKQNYVSWMDFAFYMSTSTDQGLSLFDIHYKGRRIIYELALQEALAHYASVDPTISETLYFDSQIGMGRNMVSLVKGFDCPAYATYINGTFTDQAGVHVTRDAICLFEADANYPLRRHSGVWQGYTSSVKNVVFTARWIATVGNYDYLFDYNFLHDGSIEVHLRASGYISAAYFADNEEYGFKIHDALSGAMHDHVITFKADLDILGEKNSLQTVDFLPASEVYPWSNGKARNTMKIKRGFVTNEDSANLNWAQNDATIYAVVNKDSPNKYGEYPGYRVKRAAGATSLTVQNSTNAGNAAHYATSHLFVTRQKDTEPRCADRNNALDLADPLVDFAHFLDGESLDQEDLVLWFNLGMHHLPHTGDLPNTMMTAAHSAMRFEPLNYLFGDPSVATNQQVRVERDASTGVVTGVRRFGAVAANCSVDLGSGEGV